MQQQLGISYLGPQIRSAFSRYLVVKGRGRGVLLAERLRESRSRNMYPGGLLSTPDVPDEKQKENTKQRDTNEPLFTCDNNQHNLKDHENQKFVGGFGLKKEEQTKAVGGID